MTGPVPGLDAIPSQNSAPRDERHSGSLDGALAHAIAWTGGVKLITQVVAWGSTVVVARLLTPADYGLVGMAAVYLYLIQLLSELGIGTAVVTLRTLTRDQLEQINTLSVLAGFAGFLVSCAAAIPLGRFFDSPALPAVVVAMSSTFLINSFRVVPAALLRRSLNFRPVALIDGVQALALAGVSIALAVAGFRYWTLVIGAILSAVVSTALTMRAQPCRFGRIRWDSISHALTFSWRVAVSTISWYAYTDADFIVAGKRLGEAALGVYNFAWTLANVPIEKITSLVNSVTPSIFSAAQHDRALMRRYLLLITEGISLATFPAAIGIALVANDLVLVALGDKWRGAILPLQLLVVYSSVRSITPFYAQVLNVTGSTRYAMWVNIVAAFLLPLGFYVGSHWGSGGIALAWIVVHPFVVTLPIGRRVFTNLDMSLRTYVGSVWPATASSACMAGAVLGTSVAIGTSLPGPVRLTLMIAVGGATYMGALLLFFRPRVLAVRHAWRMLRGGATANRTIAEPESVPPARMVPPAVAADPYLAATRPPVGNGQRALLIAFNFPPDQAIGALRWQKMARRFAERGWDLDVITLDPACLVATDRTRFADLPEGLRAFGVPLRPLVRQRVEAVAWWLYRSVRGAGKKAPASAPADARPVQGSPSRLRMALRAYHARVEYAQMGRWARAAAREGIRITTPGVHRVIITSGPPHMAHEAGRRIGEATGLPLVIDLRDPWSLQTIDRGLPVHVASQTWIDLARRYERPVVDVAAAIAVNTTAFERIMGEAYPMARERIVTVMNGADDDPIPPSRHDDVFRLRFAGTIYDVTAPNALFESVSRVIVELDLTPSQFQVEILMDPAHYDGVPVDIVARDVGVGDFVTVSPLRPRAEALEFLAGATMLVSLRQYSPVAIPAKLFEYVRFGAWLLVVAEPGSATELLLRGTPALLVEPGDIQATADAIRRCYHAFRRGERPEPVAASRDFRRTTQADVLIDRLDAIVGAERR